MKHLALVLGIVLALSGCSGKAGDPAAVQEDVPDEIGQKKVSDLEAEIAEKHPRAFSFPGQAVMEAKQFVLDGVVAVGEAATSLELPNDNGPCIWALLVSAGCYDAHTDVMPVIHRYDISEHVPVGQPVEMRIKLKWPGNPGASADLDIFMDVPGTQTTRDRVAFDESMNWGVVTKFAVVNTVREEGKPFDLGVQVANAKVVADEMPYQLTVDVEYAEGVLAPGIAYGLSVPANASRLVFESEPLGGDEHITGSFMLIGPDDELVRFIDYDDIGNDARAISVRAGGEYIVYAPELRGGFLRVSTDVPNEGFQARVVQTQVVEETLAQQALPPVGGTGTFTLDAFPLEMHPWIAPSNPTSGGVSGTASLNLTSVEGWVATTTIGAYAGGGQAGGAGQSMTRATDGSNLAAGEYSWTVEGSAAAAMDAGYRALTYTR